jgi:hypothetical protein
LLKALKNATQPRQSKADPAKWDAATRHENRTSLYLRNDPKVKSGRGANRVHLSFLALFLAVSTVFLIRPARAAHGLPCHSCRLPE